MNRKFLEDLGLEKDTIDKVMAEHGKTVKDLKSDDVDELKKTNDTLQSQLTEREKDLDDLKKKYEGDDGLSSQLETLQTKYNEQKTTYEQQLEQIKFDSLLNDALSQSGVRNVKAARALLDMEKLAMADDKEELLGYEEQIKAIEESDGYLFDKGTNTGGYKPTGGNPPADKEPSSMHEAIAQTIKEN